MKFDLTAAWNSTIAILRNNMSVLLPVAGVFLFLPAVLLGLVVPEPDTTGVQGFEAISDALNSYFADNWLWLLLNGIVSTIGGLALLLLFLKPGQASVGEALKMGAIALIPAFVAGIIYGIAIGLGLILLIIPGLYLMARFILVQPVIMAENTLNPITAIGRSWALTKGNGWRILGFLVILGIVAIVIILLVGAITSFLGTGLIGGEVGNFITLVLSTAISTIASVIGLAVYAAIYGQLAGPSDNNLSQTFE